MRGRQMNPGFAAGQMKTNNNGNVALNTKIKRARQDGTLNLSSTIPPLRSIPVTVFDDSIKVDEDEKFWQIEPLRSLDLSFNQLNMLPDEVGNLKDCISIKLRDNVIQSLPESLFECCTSLRHLDICKNKLHSLNGSISQLFDLRELLISENKLVDVPDSISDCPALRVIDVSSNALTRLPNDFCQYSNTIVTLNLSKNKLTKLPSSIANLRSMETLNCSNNHLTVLPDLQALYALKLLDATQNYLQTFPALPLESSKKTALQFVHLGYNNIAYIDITQINHQTELRELLLHNNKLSLVPDTLELCSQLKVLDLSNNNIRDLPASLGWMENLQHLKAEGNVIKTIRHQLLVKPADELKTFLRTRGPSITGKTEYVDGGAKRNLKHALPAKKGVGGAIEERCEPAAGGHSGSILLQEKWPVLSFRIREMNASGILDFSKTSLGGTVAGSSSVSPFGAPFGLATTVLEMPAVSTLTSVNLSNNQFISIPVDLLHPLSMVEVVDLSNNRLNLFDGRQVDYAAADCNVPSKVPLASLDVSYNKLSMSMLEQVLEVQVEVSSLQQLTANGNPLNCSLAASALFAAVLSPKPALVGLHTVRLSYCSIFSISGVDFSSATFPHLATLDLSNNKLETLTNSLYRAGRLEYLSIENNCLRAVPPELSLIASLNVLLVAGNPQRLVSQSVVLQGSAKVLELLKSRLPVKEQAQAMKSVFQATNDSATGNSAKTSAGDDRRETSTVSQVGSRADAGSSGDPHALAASDRYDDRGDYSCVRGDARDRAGPVGAGADTSRYTKGRYGGSSASSAPFATYENTGDQYNGSGGGEYSSDVAARTEPSRTQRSSHLKAFNKRVLDNPEWQS